MTGALSPDGRSVVVKARASGLFLVSTRAGTPRLIAKDFVRGELHPDGKRVVASTFSDKEGGQLYVANLDGSRRRAISPKGITPRFFVLSPDGKWVAVHSRANVVLHSTDSASPRLLRSTGPHSFAAGWSADSKYLFVYERGGGDGPPVVVSRIDIVSDRREPALTVRGEAIPSDGVIGGIYVAGDGQSYAYSYRQGHSTLILAEGLD